ncbi:MAG: CheB methylesterase domain-containing protein [Defluviitaleaceae bacterium]|nr:CheB methylesterase domain-containing protein [Defluviitaleaceae bacterium]
MTNFKDLNRMVTEFNKIIAMASSTGGTEALEKIFRALPVDVPPVVVVQHMPSGFTKLFADRLNANHALEIKEAADGDYLMKGRVLLAPADYHMKLVRQCGKLGVRCFTGTKVHGVMPAADVLFESVADISRKNAVGVVLTGMGADGARGLMMMHSQGAKTIGQDKASCVVYGMPKVAKDIGAVDFELPLDQIANKIKMLI